MIAGLDQLGGLGARVARGEGVAAVVVVVVAAPARGVLPADLADLPMVQLSTPPSPDYVLSLLREQGVEPRVAWQSGVIETVRGMVANGLGYAILTSQPWADISYDGSKLITRPLAWEAKPSSVILVRRKGERLTGTAERFAWLCRDVFGADLR